MALIPVISAVIFAIICGLTILAKVWASPHSIGIFAYFVGFEIFSATALLSAIGVCALIWFLGTCLISVIPA